MTLKTMRVSMFATALLSALVSQAAIDDVPRSKADFVNYQMDETETVRVPSAKVVAVDYELLAKDFAQLRRQNGEGEQEWKARLDRWLIEQTAFMLKQQVGQTKVNTPIPTTNETKPAYRPFGYNRAHLIPVEGGMMDAKGVGALYPMQRHHGNGLATLGEMIREYIMEKAVTSVFNHARPDIKTVGSYGVVDFGFDVVHQDGSRSRAGYILRQPHQRARGKNSTLSRENAFEVEKTLRKYGLTSSGETFAFRAQGQAQYSFDYTNVQGTNNTKNIEIIDFGAFLAVDHFSHRLVSHTDLYGASLLDPQKAEFVQPDPKRRIPLEQWGDLGTPDPKSDKAWVWSHDLATALAEGRADRSAVDTHLRNMLSPFKQKLRAVRTCRQVFSR